MNKELESLHYVETIKSTVQTVHSINKLLDAQADQLLDIKEILLAHLEFLNNQLNRLNEKS